MVVWHFVYLLYFGGNTIPGQHLLLKRTELQGVTSSRLAYCGRRFVAVVLCYKDILKSKRKWALACDLCVL